MKKLVYTIALFFICVFVNAQSQSFEKDMEMVYKNFVNINKISYNIKYLLKESHEVNSKILSQNTGRYVKIKDKYISQYSNTYTLVNPTEVILVDNQEKYIRIKKQTKNKVQEPDFLGQLKEYNKGVQKVTRLTTNKKDVVTYNVQLKNIAIYGISRYEISINTKTYFMEQMTMFYKNPLEKDPENNIKGTEVPRLDIIFFDFNSLKIYNELELNSSYYYTRGETKINPSANFKSYDVKEIL
jgi:hypothetical protein